jgi:hypothetical protein
MNKTQYCIIKRFNEINDKIQKNNNRRFSDIQLELIHRVVKRSKEAEDQTDMPNPLF